MLAANRIAPFALVLVFAGCGTDSRADQEIDAKPEYSVLQSFEFDYRRHNHLQPYIVRKNALSSGFDIVGLPRKDSSHGYVWLIANPDSKPIIKQMPNDADFSISKDVLVTIEASTRIAPPVRTYLFEHLADK